MPSADRVLPRRRGRLIRRIGVVLMVLGWLGYGLFDTAMRYHSQALAEEWWRCLVAQAPPRARDQLPADYPTDPAERAAAEAAVDPAPVVNVQELVTSSPAAVNAGKFGYENVTVAIVDSGLASPTMPDAAVPGLDTMNPCGDGLTDASGHGTAVAGIITAPEHGAAAGVTVLPVRTSLSTGVQLRWANAAAVVWATNRGADVINLSNSSHSTSPNFLERAAMRYAISRSVVIVASAGNIPYKPASYPAAYPEVISVTAVNADGKLATFAARKGAIDVAAPGARIATLAVDGEPRVVSGTSFATPFVTATVVRMLAVNPDLTPAEVHDILVRTATPLPAEATALADEPFGVLDVDAAVKAAGVDVLDGTFGRAPRPLVDTSPHTGQGGPFP